MKPCNVIDWVAAVLVVVGGLNWGLVGAFNFNLVSLIFGDATILTRLIYVIVGIAAIYVIYTFFQGSSTKTE